MIHDLLILLSLSLFQCHNMIHDLLILLTLCFSVMPKDPSHGSGGESIIQSLVSPPGARLSGAGQRLSGSQEKLYRLRKCSLIQEESLEEEDYEEEMDTDLKSVRSLDDLDESLPQEPCTSDSVSSRRSLHTVASSPQLLNQIHEERESDEEDDIVPHKIHAPRTLISRNNATSPDMLGKYEQRKKRRGAGQRGTSCSSSDASDTDDTEGRSRKDKLKHKILHRRDSSDHSSDNDGGPSGHGHSGGGQSFNGGDNNGSGGGRGNPDNDRKDQGGKDGSDGKGSRGSYNSKQNGGMGMRTANISNDSNSKLGGLFTRRISELSVASTISSLSLTSINSKNSLKYMVDMEDIRTGSKRNSLQEEIERLNMVNARLIEVKEFVDITDFQSHANKSSSGGSVCSSDCNLSHRKGRSPRIKTDINSNGLKPEHLSRNGSQAHLTAVKETRCCSLI